MQDPHSSQDSTRSLVQRGRAGDRSAWERVFGRIMSRMRSWAHFRMPQASRGLDQTRDVVQDAAMGVWRQMERLDLHEPGDLEAYVRQAVINRIRDGARRAQRQPTGVLLDSQIPNGLPSPLSEAISRERWERYQAAFNELPVTQREAVIARVDMGYSFDQVAEVIGSPSAAAARMTVVRAIARLRLAVDDPPR